MKFLGYFLGYIISVSFVFPNTDTASILNDTADAILAQSEIPEAYAASLLAQLDSAVESTIWKNYILQKLDVLYLHPDVDAEMRSVILARL